VIVAGAVLVALVRPALGGFRLRSGRARLAGVLALVALGVVAAGYARQRTYNEARYASGDPVLTWLHDHAAEGHRIALGGAWTAGVSPVLPAFGPRYRNTVTYVSDSQQRVLREFEDEADWADALRSGRHDLLVVGRGGYTAACPIPGSETDEDAWAREQGFAVLAQSDRLTLYRLPAGG
jgi:hypothetical protein